MTERTLSLVRQGYRLLSLVPSRGVSVVRVSPYAEMRVFRPKGAAPGARPALLWTHGGGYIVGKAKQDDGLCRRFANQLGIVVASVDYRLAPEAPFPAALDDCLAALQHLVGVPGVDADRTQSAAPAPAPDWPPPSPCGPTARTGPPSPSSCSPIQCSTTGQPSVRTGTRRTCERGTPRRTPSAGILTSGRAPQAPTTSHRWPRPRAQDLAGLPPAWWGVGTMDLFHDEDLAYAARLTESGVACTITVVPGAFHGFDILAPRAAVSRDFTATQVEALRQALQP